MSKFYNKINSYIKRRRGGPFSRGTIAQSLMNAGRGKLFDGKEGNQLEKEIHRYRKQVDLIRRLEIHFSKPRCTYARAEVIVSTLEPEFMYHIRGQWVALEYLVNRDIIREESLLFLGSDLVSNEVSLLCTDNT